MQALEPSIVTLMMMIVVSSFTLSCMVAFLGKNEGSPSTPLLSASLLYFGLAYILFCFLFHPAKPVFFTFAHIAFNAGLCSLLAALLRFYQQPIPRRLLVCIPLLTGLVFWAFLHSPTLRTRMACLCFLIAPVWMLVLLLRRSPAQWGKGEWLVCAGLLCIVGGVLARMWKPYLSITSPELGLNMLKASSAVVFVALHLLTMGFFLMERARRERGWQKEVDEDALTGTLSRRGMLHSLQANIEACQRNGHPLSLLLLDIDHFKHINDQCGHIAGDHVLRDVGQLLRLQLRQGCSVGRYGGEEFLVICPHSTGKEAWAQAERLRAAVQNQIHASGNGQNLPVTVSVGVYTYAGKGHAQSWEQLVQSADCALYQAKHQGRNQVRSYAAAVSDTTTTHDSSLVL